MKVRTITGIAIVIALIGFSAGCAFGEKTAVISAGEETTENVEAETETVYLCPDSAESADAEIIRTRLKVLAGEKAFELKERGGFYELRLDREVRGYDSLETLINLYVIGKQSFSVVQGTEELLALKPETVTEIRAENDASSGLHRITLLFDKDAADLIPAHAASSDSGLGLEIKSGKFQCVYELLYDENKNRYYIEFDDTDILFDREDALIHIIKEQAPIGTWTAYYPIDIEWERDAAENSNRRNKEEIGDNSYVIQYSAVERMTKDEREKNREIWLARLNALGAPYAFGMSEYGDVQVCIAGDGISRTILSRLAQNLEEVTIENGTDRASFYVSGSNAGKSVLIIDEKTGGPKLISTDELMEQVKDWKVSDKQPMYLFFDWSGVPIAVSTDPLGIQDNTVRFERIWSEGQGGMKELLYEMCRAPQYAGNYKLDFFMNDEGLMDPSHFGFGIQQVYDTSHVEAVVRGICSGATISWNASGTMIVEMHHELNDDFTDTTVREIKEIISALQYDSKINPLISIYPADTIDNEYCHIVLDRDTDRYKSQTPTTKVRLSLTWGVAGDRMEKYRKEFEQKLKIAEDQYEFSIFK